MKWIIEHWEYILITFMAIEKAVKLSPAKWDDIIIDGIRWVFSRLAGEEADETKS